MNPIDQREPDDCLRACAAMVLDIPYEETPEIRGADYLYPGGSNAFWLRWGMWAASRGLTPFWWESEHPVHLDAWVAVVPSVGRPDASHAVVMEHTRLFHDPCPAGRREHVTPGDVKFGLVFA